MANLPISGASAPLSFSFDQSFSVRVVMRDGEPWFVAADVLAALSLDRKALERLDDDEKGVSSIHTPGGDQDMTIINESGLYSLILGSRKPEAKKFKKWVTSEVLPSIRKTGGYQMPSVEVPVSLETVNSADLNKLAQIVYLIRTNFHMDGQASHAAYAHLRKEFGLEKGVASLPAIYFDQALQILSELNRLSFRFKGIVIDAERKFFRQVLRAGKALDEDEFNALFDAELQQMMENHRDSLKLLN